MQTNDLTLLAVEVHRDDLSVVEASLRRAFPTDSVLTATPDASVVAVAVAQQPDVILIAVEAPHTDSFAACRSLKAEPRTRDIPLIFVMDYAGERELRSKAFEAGCEAVVAKPIDIVELSAQVRTMARLNAASRERNKEQRRPSEQLAEERRELEDSQLAVLQLADELQVDNQALRSREASLRERNVLLETAGRRARFGGWRVELPENRVIWSEQVAAIHEVPLEFSPTVEQALAFYAPECQKTMAERFGACVREGLPYEEELQLISGQGTRLWVRTSGEAVRDQAGEITGAVGAFQDITERKRVEEALRESVESYRALLDRLPDIVMRFDCAGRHLFVSENVARVVAHKASSFIGKTHRELGFPPEQCQLWEAAIQSVFDTGEPHASEFTLDGLHGPTTFDWHLAAERDAAGRVQTVLSVSRDVTAHRKLQQDYRTLFREMLEGFALHEIICDASGQPVDYRFLSVNPEFERMTGLNAARIVGKRVLEVMPDTESYWIARYGKVALTGEPAHFENFSSELNKHFSVTAFRPAPGQFACVVQDTTHSKLAEQALQRRHVLDQALLRILKLQATRPETALALAVEQLVELTESELGFIGFVDAEEATISAHLWSSPAMRDYCVENQQLTFSVRSGDLWAAAVIEHRPIVGNDSTAPGHPNQELPYGNVKLHRFLAVPVMREGRAVLLAGLGNKTKPYEAADVTETGLFLEGVWGFLSRVHAENERRKLEEQLRMSQKLEAIGGLAGGIAHDFNNLIGVILNCAGFALEGVAEDDSVRDDLIEIQKAGERAATLTRQLLAFSRKQLLQPVPLNLNEIARGIEMMLRRILGEDVEIAQLLADDLGLIRADPGQMEQVLMNLAVNARDAMPKGGKLTVETSNVVLDEPFATSHVSVVPGEYIRLAVSDTGAGMDEETMARVFEPFFTTKEQGRGTGLGLSTVYGIVKQSGGTIWVYSEPGQGTTFKVYLPRAQPLTESESPQGEPQRSMRGSETVLLVEDEDGLRRAATRSLVRAGYTVLSAAAGDEALRLAASHFGEIHLLLTDVVMPRMNGRQLSEAMVEMRPRIKILFMSGYTDHAIVHHGVIDAGTSFVGKPFTALELAAKVREVLDR